MQTQKEFAKELKETVNKLMGNGYKAEVHSVEKTNIGTVHALIISNSSSNISPNFYIEEFYSSYQQGKATIKEIAESIVESYSHNIIKSIKGNGLEIHFNDKEWVKERLFLQLINSRKNKVLLNDAVHSDYADFSLVLNVMVSNDEKGIYKARITKKICEHFGWDEKDILNYALENTVHLLPYAEFPLYELLQKTISDIGMDIPKVSGAPEITVLTNDVGVNGATAIFYPNVLKEIAERHGTSLFLLPSSVHEFIILEDDGICNPEELKNMVQEVNGSAVPPEDVLSDNIYYYGRNSGVLSVFNNGKLKEIAIP